MRENVDRMDSQVFTDDFEIVYELLNAAVQYLWIDDVGRPATIPHNQEHDSPIARQIFEIVDQVITVWNHKNTRPVADPFKKQTDSIVRRGVSVDLNHGEWL